MLLASLMLLVSHQNIQLIHHASTSVCFLSSPVSLPQKKNILLQHTWGQEKLLISTEVTHVSTCSNILDIKMSLVNMNNLISGEVWFILKRSASKLHLSLKCKLHELQLYTTFLPLFPSQNYQPLLVLRYGWHESWTLGEFMEATVLK